MPAAPVRVPPAVGGAGCLRRLCGLGGGARSASGPVGGSGAGRGVSVLGTARNRSATEVNSVDAPTTAGGHPPPRPLLAVRACRPPHAAPHPRRTRLPAALAAGSPLRRRRHRCTQSPRRPSCRHPPRRPNCEHPPHRRSCGHPPRRPNCEHPPHRRSCGHPPRRPSCGQSCRWGGTGGRSGTPQRRAALPTRAHTHAGRPGNPGPVGPPRPHPRRVSRPRRAGGPTPAPTPGDPATPDRSAPAPPPDGVSPAAPPRWRACRRGSQHGA
ncbi:hypothetical protein SUDANB151_03994 [Streptomyces sp. enrichment culture]